MDESAAPLLASPDSLLPLLPGQSTGPSDSRQPTTSTYTRHLRGWLTYAFASEAFAVCSLGLFLPILLEQFARDNGVLMPDRLVPCVPPPIGTSGTDGGMEVMEDARCVVRLGWAWVDTASFSLYVYSTSVAIQALTVISMGGLADRPTLRKPLLLSFAAIGSLSATLFLLLPSRSIIWPACALLAILANVAFGASIVALNAYLPSLARDSPDPLAAQQEVDDLVKRWPELEDDALQASLVEARMKLHETTSRATARISSRGIGLGYAAGILVLLFLLIPSTLLHGSTFSLRLCVGLTGIWWAAFTLPAALWLPSAHTHTHTPAPSSAAKHPPRSAAQEIARSWRELFRLLHPSNIRRLKSTFRFLCAWFLLSDAFTTISSTAILFGKTALHMPSSSLILVAVLAPLSGVAGALACNALQHRYGWTNLRILITLVCAVALVPLYGCLGFFLPPSIPLGLRKPGEMYALAIYYGSIMGAFQSYARAVFSELVPRGEEARWFGLYSITDKSSSFLGPLVVGVVSDRTGEIRGAFWFLLALVGVAGPVLWGVDVGRGREEVRAYEREVGVLGGEGAADGEEGEGVDGRELEDEEGV